MAGEEGLEPSHVGIKIRCLDQLGDSPTIIKKLTEFEFEAPLVTQIVSPYPSIAETSSWANEIFADGRGAVDPNDYCGLTFAKCACAITSLSMLGKYYGILNGVDDTAVNPLNMNDWLLHGGEQEGYDSRGNMMWAWGLAYLSKNVGGKYLSHFKIDNAAATDSGEVRTFIEMKGPALGFSYTPGHWFVLESLTNTGYNVKDPYWYDTKTTNDEKNGSATVRDYNDQFKKAALFSYRTTPKLIQKMVEFSLNSPAELLITDEEGRRLGYDAETGEYVNEIVGGSYDPEYAIIDQGNPATNPHYTKHLMLVEPEGEAFELEVIGTGNGSYSLTSAISDGLGTLDGGSMVEEISDGEVHRYTIMTRTGTDDLPQYLKDILELVPVSEQKKFTHAFRVIFAQTEKNHVAVTETLVENLIKYTKKQFGNTSWADGVVHALEELLP